MNSKTIHIQYFAVLREQRGLSQEKLSTDAKTTQDLYRELQTKHNLKISINLLKVAVNNEFKDWHTELRSDDHVVFIPPVAGG